MTESSEFQRYTYEPRVIVHGRKITQFNGESLDIIAKRAEELGELFGNAIEVQEVSWTWGPDVMERNYRVTDADDSVRDWKVRYDEDWTITDAFAYDRIV